MRSLVRNEKKDRFNSHYFCSNTLKKGGVFNRLNKHKGPVLLKILLK